jgi:hypothetical protein
MLHSLAPFNSFSNLAKSAHLSLSVISTGMTLTSSDTSVREKTISALSNLVGSFFTLPEDLYKTYIVGTAAVGLAHVGYNYYNSDPSSLLNVTHTPTKSFVEEKIYAVANAVTTGYQAALATATSMVIYVSSGELVKAFTDNLIFEYTGLALAVSLPAIFNEVSRTYSDYGFLSFQNIIAECVSYALVIKMASGLGGSNSGQPA